MYLLILLFTITSDSFARVGSAECEAGLKAYDFECSVQSDYRELKNYFNEQGINVENLTGYKSLRFVKDKHWYGRKDDFLCRPWEFYAPKPKAWLFWERGNFWVTKLSKQEGREKLLTQKLIANIHKAAIDNSLIGIFAKLKGTSPGSMRSNWWQVPPGFSVDCDEFEINQTAYDLLKDYDLKDDSGKPLVSITSLSPACKKADEPDEIYHGGTVTYASSSIVEKEMEKLIKYTNKEIERIQSGESKLGIYDLMADVQRWYVSIHPFGDGNGRTSRYLQDFIARKFDLPLLRGGFLQGDVFVTKETYRSKTRENITETMSFLRKCKEFYSEGKSQEQMPCECRPLYNGKEKLTQITNSINTESSEEIDCPQAKQGIQISEDIDSFEDLSLWMISNAIYQESDE